MKYYFHMTENIFALTCDKDFENKLFLLRKKLFKLSDDETIFALPPYIILGKTEKRSFDRKHYNLKLFFDGSYVDSEYGKLLTARDDKELKEIQKSLNITPSPVGIYISKRALPTLAEILISKHQRLVLLKSFQDGFIVLQ